MIDRRVVFITGAGGGIGRAIGERFADSGAMVVFSDRDEQSARAAAEAVSTVGGLADFAVCDVCADADIEGAIDAAYGKYGRIDVWINNAGMQHVSPLEEFPTEMFERMVRIMLTAPFVAIKHVFPIMKRQRFGRIINMASINGLIGFAGKAAYNSAKHGLIGLTKVAALEGAQHGITVNAICPGYVDTPLVRNQLADLARTRGVSLERVLEEVIYPLVPQQRLLDPAEIAELALFVAGEQASGITGQPLVIDGGYTAQ